jgi:hypothetical protein
MDSETLIKKHDALLKNILRRYGVKEEQLALCTMELLMAMVNIMEDVRQEYDKDS